MNRRVVHTRGGTPADVLTVVEEPEPAAPGYGQVLIRTTVFPVHHGDLLAVESYPGEAPEPVPVGVEATGVVEAIGPGARVAPGVKVGGRVSAGSGSRVAAATGPHRRLRTVPRPRRSAGRR
ncbi:alcohol dehydrogenase catalytic domain-containing protein, partial [Streptomyces sp. NPDC001215]